MACSRKLKERKAEQCQVLAVTWFQNNKPGKCTRMNSVISPIYSTAPSIPQSIGSGQRPSLSKMCDFTGILRRANCSFFFFFFSFRIHAFYLYGVLYQSLSCGSGLVAVVLYVVPFLVAMLKFQHFYQPQII